MLLIAYGTRPEWLKIKPIIEELKRRNLSFKTLFTGQHFDLIKHTKPKPNFNLGIEDFDNVDRLNNVLASTIINGSSVLNKAKWVMVQGDTTSALAIALAAYNQGKKVIHVEAGLRTYDLNNPFPEEANRQIISRIAYLHFCPTTRNFLNLRNENVSNGPNPFVVGNTALDNLVKHIDRCQYLNKVLITLHRRENHDIIDKWFEAFENLATDKPDTEFILPIHPNPNVQKYRYLLKNVKVIEPLEHDEFLELLIKCKLVISDSGGLQEEASFLKKKVLVCRKETERQEALDLTSFLTTPKKLYDDYCYHVDYKKPNEIEEHECPFGDGKAAEKIVEILKDYVYDIA
jgi:UDP-N-acetylglucosamine 2-epimerase (non-hydrolysing)